MKYYNKTFEIFTVIGVVDVRLGDLNIFRFLWLKFYYGKPILIVTLAFCCFWRFNHIIIIHIYKTVFLLVNKRKKDWTDWDLFLHEAG